MNKPHILIVDDEANIRLVLERTLSHEGYRLDTAANGAEALQKIAKTDYDLMVLDLHMEPIDGLQVLKDSRVQNSDMMIIILTAYSSVESAITALRGEAFDYLLKPVEPQALRQRVAEGLVKLTYQRQQHQLMGQIDTLRDTLNQLDTCPIPHQAARQLISGKLVMDCHQRQANFAQQPLNLTTTEFDMLFCLVNTAPNPVTPRQLVNCALGYDSDEVKAREIVKWHIHQLRRKIEPDAAHPRYIKNIRYKGYLWTSDTSK